MPPIYLHACFAAALTLMPLAAEADFAAQTALWHYKVHGSAEDPSGTVNFDEYQIDGDAEPYVTLRYLQDQQNAWPDMAFAYSRIEADGLHQVREPTAIGDLVLAPGTTARTRANVDDLTLAFSYTLLDAPLNLTAGVAVRYLGGSILIRDTGAANQDAQSLHETFPLLTASLRWPITRWLAVTANGAWIHYQHNGAYEWYAGAEVAVFTGISLEAGWMVKRYNVLSDDYRFDSRLDGGRVGLLWRF